MTISRADFNDALERSEANEDNWGGVLQTDEGRLRGVIQSGDYAIIVSVVEPMKLRGEPDEQGRVDAVRPRDEVEHVVDIQYGRREGYRRIRCGRDDRVALSVSLEVAGIIDELRVHEETNRLRGYLQKGAFEADIDDLRDMQRLAMEGDLA